MVGARELPLAEAPAVHSTVERLALLAGVPKPRLYLLADPLPAGPLGGRGARGAAIAVSRGLLARRSPRPSSRACSRTSSRRSRNRDVTVQTPPSSLAAMVIETSRIGGWLERALLFVLGAVAAAFLHLLLSTSASSRPIASRRDSAARRTASPTR